MIFNFCFSEFIQYAFAHFGYCVTFTFLIGLVNKFFVDGIVICISIISPVEVFSCLHPFLTRSQFFLVVLCAMILFVNVQNFASFQWFLCFFLQKVRQMPLDEVVIVDADTNVVESPFDDLAQLPSDTVSVAVADT